METFQIPKQATNVFFPWIVKINFLEATLYGGEKLIFLERSLHIARMTPQRSQGAPEATRSHPRILKIDPNLAPK